MEPRTSNQTIDDEAAGWAARLDRGSLTDSESERLASWLAADSRHQGALARAQALLVPFEKANATITSESADEWPDNTMKRVVAAVASMAATFAVLAALFLYSPHDNKDYQTAYGEVRRVPLNDGSIMTLNTLSKVDLEFGETQRSVKLLSGEGYFEVAPDSSRPFVVSSVGYSVKAIGTAFVVRNLTDQTFQVLVYEGVVEVDGRNTQPIEVTAGKLVEVSAANGDLQVSHLDDEQLLQGLAWREGKIALTGQTLEYAAREFNRYNEITIVTEPSVSDLEIVGWYSANDPIGFAELVASTMDIQAKVQKDRVVLTSSPASSDN